MTVVKLFQRDDVMYLAQMKLLEGACCMTGELHGFSCSNITNVTYGGKITEQQYIERHYGTPTFENKYAKREGRFLGLGDTKEEAWRNCLRAVQVYDANTFSYHGVQVRYLWFVDYKDGDGYQNDALRQVVANLPNVVKLGEHINSNTTHKLDGYMLPFENENGRDGDEDADDDY